jgi:hypothetical protein
LLLRHGSTHSRVGGEEGDEGERGSLAEEHLECFKLVKMKCGEWYNCSVVNVIVL